MTSSTFSSTDKEMCHLAYKEGKKALKEGYLPDPNYEVHPDPSRGSMFWSETDIHPPLETDTFPQKGSVIFAHPCQQQNRKIIGFKENKHKNSPS